MNIPFLGFLTSPQSAETLLFIVELFGILLFLLVLFLVIHFRQESLLNLSRVILENWKSSLLYLVLGVVVLPVLVLLLIVSVIGVFLVPVLLVFIIALTYFGFIGASVKFGALILKGEPESPVRLFLCGILGFIIIRSPVLLGRLLSLLTSDALIATGSFLKVIGAVVLFVFVVYSFGSGLLYAKTASRQS
jgi:hypothetical protein